MKEVLQSCRSTLITFIVICLAFLLVLIAMLRDSYLSKDEIFDVVNKKYDIIMADVKKGEFNKTKRIRGIEDISENDGVIKFFCGGEGNVVSGAYYGFYYTEDNLPKVSFLSVLFDEEDLVPQGKGYCFDKYDYYYTEKIRDNLYYYEYYY